MSQKPLVGLLYSEAPCPLPCDLLGSGCRQSPSRIFLHIPFQWHDLIFAWPFFLFHTLPSHPSGKVAETWKIISLWPWGPLQLPSEGSMKEVPKTGEEKWKPKVFFLFSFLNFHVFDYNIFLPQPISDDAFFHRLTFYFLFYYEAY